jgi:hypothetical protein
MFLVLIAAMATAVVALKAENARLAAAQAAVQP